LIARAPSIRGRLFPAVPTPLDANGRIHREGLERLVGWISGLAVGGVAVWTPIGRGDRLGPIARAEIFRAWRSGLGEGPTLIAAAGPAAGARHPDDVVESARLMAEEAAGLGADAVLALPPGPYRGRPDRDRLVLEYHAALAVPGLPLLISYRREDAGGIAYGPEVLAQLLARPEVIGVQVATIDGIVAFQQVAALVRDQAPEKRVVSGEERFLGYSLMCGADSAIVGLGAAYPSESIKLIGAHVSGDAARFLELSADLDRRARLIFRAPMEGSVLRLLKSLVQIGVLPPDAAHDPWGPRSGPSGGTPAGEGHDRGGNRRGSTG